MEEVGSLEDSIARFRQDEGVRRPLSKDEGESWMLLLALRSSLQASPWIPRLQELHSMGLIPGYRCLVNE